MGAVYRARDAEGREVALKVLIRELASEPRYVERFRREALAARDVARGLAGQQTLTLTGELLGTFEYVAPEQTEHAKVDFRADLYSFGAVLYELLAGRPPFAGGGLALIAQHISAAPRPPREH